MCIIKILLVIVLLIIIFNNNFFETFQNVELRGTSDIDGSRNNDIININLDNPFINPYDLSSEQQTNLNNTRAINYDKSDYLQQYLDNKIKVYTQSVLAENNDVTYYYNTLYNNNDVTENAYNVINSIDGIDYSKIKESGREKCIKNCKGTCVDGGFTGVASCMPIVGTNYGTLYKNPEFTYGLDVPYYNVNNKEL